MLRYFYNEATGDFYPAPPVSNGFADLGTASSPSDLTTRITLRENNENRCWDGHPLRPSLDRC